MSIDNNQHEELDDARTAPKSTGLSAPLRRRMAAVLAVLVVAGAVAAFVSFSKLAAAEEQLDARADVARVAERFTVQVNNYGADSVEDYQSAVGEMLSTKFQGEFEKAMKDIVASVTEAEMNSEGTVLASGVATMDDDSARVLVVADADVKTVFDTRQRHFRWEVALVKVDGEWLVDDFTPVT